MSKIATVILFFLIFFASIASLALNVDDGELPIIITKNMYDLRQDLEHPYESIYELLGCTGDCPRDAALKILQKQMTNKCYKHKSKIEKNIRDCLITEMRKLNDRQPDILEKFCTEKNIKRIGNWMRGEVTQEIFLDFLMRDTSSTNEPHWYFENKHTIELGILAALAEIQQKSIHFYNKRNSSQNLVNFDEKGNFYLVHTFHQPNHKGEVIHLFSNSDDNNFIKLMKIPVPKILDTTDRVESDESTSNSETTEYPCLDIPQRKSVADSNKMEVDERR